MNPFRRILVLFAIVSAIIAFWLMPGINKANSVNYVRVYEDTDRRASIKSADEEKIHVMSVVDSVIRERKKVYKKESIERNAKIKDIKPSMYSRAIHFKEEPKVVKVDSVSEIQFTSVDSLKQIQ